jgi:hypothetical protein
MRFRRLEAARILQRNFPVKVVLLCVVILAAIAIALAARAIRSNAGVPSLDDPSNVTPPPARDMSQNDRHGEHL